MGHILVTGAAGFIGSQLAYALWKQGENVTLIDDFSYGLEDNLIFEDYDFREEILRNDICDVTFLHSLCKEKKFDYIYHIAAITPLPDCQTNPVRALEVNVGGTVNILEAARLFGVKNVIFASTSAVYENCKTFPSKEADVTYPSLVYSGSKFSAEQFCRSFVEVYGINVTVLRFANVYGPHIDCLRTQPPVAGYIIRELYYNRQAILHSTGQQERDFIYVDDLIDLAIKVQKNTGFDVSNVSSNETHSINELYEIISKIMDKESIQPVYQQSSNYWERYPHLYEDVFPISNKILENEVNKYTCCDNNHAKEKYGWEPTTSFQTGLERTVDFAVKTISKMDGTK